MNNGDKHKDKRVIRDSVFSVFDYMLSHHNMSFLGFLVLHLAENFQIQMFTLSKFFNNYWSSSVFYNIVSSVFSYFQLDQSKLFDLFSYCVVLYSFFFVILILIVSFLHVLVCVKKNYSVRFSWSAVLRLISDMFVPVIYMPLLSILNI